MKELYKMKEDEKEQIINAIAGFLKKRKRISFVYFFGSFLEKESIEFRDIDIAIYLSPLKIKEDESFDYETHLAIELSRALHFLADLIDIKILNFVSKTFQNNVFSRGRLIFAKNEDLLANLIEESSQEAVENYEFCKQSLFELIS